MLKRCRIFFLILAFGSMAQSAIDISSPEISSLLLASEASIGKSLVILVEASDNQTGISPVVGGFFGFGKKGFYAVLTSASGIEMVYASKAEQVSVNQFALTFDIKSTMSPGEYILDQIKIADNASNQSEYNRSNLAGSKNYSINNKETSVPVFKVIIHSNIDSNDFQSPQIKSVVPSGPMVVGQDAVIIVEATDNSTGVSATIGDPFGYGKKGFYGILTSTIGLETVFSTKVEKLSFNRFALTFDIKSTMSPGEYALEFIQIADNANNQTEYRASYLTKIQNYLIGNTETSIPVLKVIIAEKK